MHTLFLTEEDALAAGLLAGDGAGKRISADAYELDTTVFSTNTHCFIHCQTRSSQLSNYN
jgi:hypothetical protein